MSLKPGMRDKMGMSSISIHKGFKIKYWHPEMNISPDVLGWEDEAFAFWVIMIRADYRLIC